MKTTGNGILQVIKFLEFYFEKLKCSYLIRIVWSSIHDNTEMAVFTNLYSTHAQ